MDTIGKMCWLILPLNCQTQEEDMGDKRRDKRGKGSGKGGEEESAG